MNTKNRKLTIAIALASAVMTSYASASTILHFSDEITDELVRSAGQQAHSSHEIDIAASVNPPSVTWSDPSNLTVAGIISRENIAILSTAVITQAAAMADTHNGAGVCFTTTDKPRITITNGTTTTAFTTTDGLNLYVQAGTDIETYDGTKLLCVGAGTTPNSNDPGWTAKAQFRLKINEGSQLPIGHITMDLPYYILAG
ncbi:hypothetical protein HAY25_004862 [Salmonella enterica]|nr:hypothetical protein [Salmonella enterica]